MQWWCKLLRLFLLLAVLNGSALKLTAQSLETTTQKITEKTRETRTFRFGNITQTTTTTTTVTSGTPQATTNPVSPFLGLNLLVPITAIEKDAPVVPVSGMMFISQLPASEGTSILFPLPKDLKIIELDEENKLDKSELDKIKEPIEEPEPDPAHFGKLGTSFDRTDLFYWWIKSAPILPLATHGASSSHLLPGDPQNQIALGNNSLSTGAHAGGLFTWTLDMSKDGQPLSSFEVTYFFLGSRSQSAFAGSPSISTGEALGRPYYDVNQQQFSVLPIAVPGQSLGSIQETLSSRVTGWEVNHVSEVHKDSWFEIDAILGWRYFQFNEGLLINSTTVPLASSGLSSGWSNSADQIDGHNAFHGGQVGYRMQMNPCRFFLESEVKFAFGANFQTVDRTGVTVVQSPINGSLITQQGGFYVQPGNTGRVVKSVFAFLPQGNFRFGFYITPKSRLSVGYNFLYLSNAVRPTDQIDPRLNLNQFNAVSNHTPLSGPLLPSSNVQSTNLWIQGITIGFESSY